MNELLDNGSSNDTVIVRLRAALDEVTAEAAPVRPVAVGHYLSAGRWLAMAAATILVVGAATAVVINRHNAPETTSTPTDLATTVPTTEPTATEPTLIRVVTPWYTLASEDLVPGEVVTLPNRLADETSVVWALGGNPGDGLFILRSGPGSPDMAPADTSLAGYQMIGDQAVAVSSYGIDAQQQADLLAQVQPGSGLPWVLPVDGWTYLGMGTGNDGATFEQTYTSDAGAVTIDVGPLANQFLTLATVGSIEPVSVAGHNGWKAASGDGVYVLWPAGDSGYWASMTISAAFADRVEGLIAAVAEVDPTQPTIETVPVPDTAVAETVPTPDDGSDAHVTLTGEALPMLDESAATDAAVGMPAPAVIGHDYEGNEVRIDPADGPQLVLFVAHWCPHCNAELPDVVQWMADGTIPPWLPVTLVSTAESPSSANHPADTWLQEMGWTGRVIRDASNGDGVAGAVAATYGATGWPYYVLIGADGTVAARQTGELSTAGMTSLLANLPVTTIGTIAIPALGFTSPVVRSVAAATSPYLFRGPSPEAAAPGALSTIDLGAVGGAPPDLEVLHVGDQFTWTSPTGTIIFEMTGGITCTGADCSPAGDETLVLIAGEQLTRIWAQPVG